MYRIKDYYTNKIIAEGFKTKTNARLWDYERIRQNLKDKKIFNILIIIEKYE